MAGHYLQLLKNIINDYDNKIADINMMRGVEMNVLLHEFNNNAYEYDATQNLVDVISKTVAEN